MDSTNSSKNGVKAILIVLALVLLVGVAVLIAKPDLLKGYTSIELGSGNVEVVTVEPAEFDLGENGLVNVSYEPPSEAEVRFDLIFDRDLTLTELSTQVESFDELMGGAEGYVLETRTGNSGNFNLEKLMFSEPGVYLAVVSDDNTFKARNLLVRVPNTDPIFDASVNTPGGSDM